MAKITSLNSLRMRYVEIVFSNQCNLSCKYCYVDQKPCLLTTEDLVEMYNFIETLPKMDTFAIRIFGGEPLIHKDLVYEFIQLVNNKYPVIIFTNGILLDEDFILKIKPYKVYLNFSLDGNKEAHNSSRIDKNGEGSYDRVVEKVLLYCKLNGMEPKRLRLKQTITTHNFKYLKQSYMDVINKKIPFTISSSFNRDEYWSDEILNELKDVLYETADYYINNFDGSVYFDLFFQPVFALQYCRKTFCSAGIDTMAIGPDKNIYPCPHFFNYNWTLGNCKYGLNFEKIDKFLSHIPTYDREKCKNCDTFKYNNCVGPCIAGLEGNPDIFDSICNLQKLLLEVGLYVREKLKNNPDYLTLLYSEGGKKNK